MMNNIFNVRNRLQNGKKIAKHLCVHTCVAIAFLKEAHTRKNSNLQINIFLLSYNSIPVIHQYIITLGKLS